MNAKDLKPGVEYALGRGDVRREWWSFRRCVFVSRAKPQYDQFNRTKLLNSGAVIVRLIDSPTPPPPTSGYRVIDVDKRKKGEELEIQPKYLISWTWEDLEKEVGTARKEEAAMRKREAELVTYFEELGIAKKHLNLGRNSLSYYDEQINMMFGHDDLDESKIQLPFVIFRKLVAGTEITEKDWK